MNLNLSCRFKKLRAHIPHKAINVDLLWKSAKRYSWFILGLAFFFDATQIWAKERVVGPSHFMVGPGLFDVDRTHPKFMGQIEYRWAVKWRNVRPLAAFFITTEANFFICGGVGYDIFLGKRVVLTPSFAPGFYYQGHGKKLWFPINYRSAIELAFVFKNKGRLGAQFNHISHASAGYKNPGANSLYIFYAIPFPHKKKAKPNGNT